MTEEYARIVYQALKETRDILELRGKSTGEGWARDHEAEKMHTWDSNNPPLPVTWDDPEAVRWGPLGAVKLACNRALAAVTDTTGISEQELRLDVLYRLEIASSVLSSTGMGVRPATRRIPFLSVVQKVGFWAPLKVASAAVVDWETLHPWLRPVPVSLVVEAVDDAATPLVVDIEVLP